MYKMIFFLRIYTSEHYKWNAVGVHGMGYNVTGKLVQQYKMLYFDW